MFIKINNAFFNVMELMELQSMWLNIIFFSVYFWKGWNQDFTPS